MIQKLSNFAFLLLILIDDGGTLVLCGNETQSAQQNLTDGKQEIDLNSMGRREYKKPLSSQNNKITTDRCFEEKLLEKIASSKSQSWPVSSDSPGVDVFLSMQLFRMDEVSEKGQAITVKILVRQEWTNPALKWIPKENGNLTELLVAKDQIWTPKIHLFNGAGIQGRYIQITRGIYISKSKQNREENKTRKQDEDQTRARRSQVDRAASVMLETLMVTVNHGGNCSLTYIDFFKSTCAIDVTFFPFDEQTCNLEFGSWGLDERYLRLKVKDHDALGDRTEYERNGEWAMARAFLAERRVKYRLQNRHYSTVALVIHVERKYLFYMMNLVIPCALIACMIFLVFLLPPKSGERISLGITVLLSMAIFQELSSEKLPSSSDTFPLLGIYYTVSIFEIGMAMALNCLVLNFYHRNQRMSPLVRKLLLGKLATFLRVEMTPRKFSREDTFEESVDEVETSFGKGMNANSIGLGSLSQVKIEKDAESDNLKRLGSFRGSLKERLVNNHDNDTDEMNTRSQSPLLSRKSMQIRNDGGNMRNGSVKRKAMETKRNEEEWKDAAKVLDRLLLAISIVIGVVSASVIFLQSERFRRMFLPGGNKNG